MKNLILSPSIDGVFARRWVKDNPNFDITLVYYIEDETEYTNLSKEFNMFKCVAEKWVGVKTFFENNPQILEQYDNFFFIDEDIEIDTQSINELFEIHSKYNLNLSQPSITGHASHHITTQHPSCLLRYVSFVEIMCPIMSRDCLKKLLYTFDMSISGWGLDIIWGKILNYEKMAIIDKVVAEHTRPACNNYNKRFKIPPIEERNMLCEKFSARSLREEYSRVSLNK